MQGIKHILWDLDGVLFHYSNAFIEKCYDAYAATAVQLIEGMDHQNALRLAKKSYDDHRAPVQVFVTDYGIDQRHFLKTFGPLVDFSVLPTDPTLQEKIKRAALKNGILTTSGKAWATRMLNHLQLAPLFPMETIIALDEDEYVGLSKAKSIEPYVIALNALQAAPHETVMIEDTQKNLRFAKEAGLTTLWVRPRSGEKQEDFTDYIFDDPHTFLDFFLDAQQRP